jgi:hypothetical protein
VRITEADRLLAHRPDGPEYRGEFESRTIVVSAPVLDPEDFRQLGGRFGAVADVRREPAGLTSIRFFDLRAARLMRTSEIIAEGRPMEMGFGPQLEVTNPRRPPNNGTIVVFHISTGVTDESICAEFERFGDIRQIRSTPHRENQKFIEFWDSRSAQKAAEEMNGRWVFGARIAVDFSLPGGCRKMAEPPKVPTIQKKDKSPPICLSAAFDRST